ncbi:MAG: hypothetical protein QW051_04400 [Candidatus Aenigmatarchaeota archaeon]
MSNEKISEYLSYFSLKYQRLTYEYLVSVVLSFTYLFMIIYIILTSTMIDVYIRLFLLFVNLFAILLFNIGIRRVYIASIVDMEKKMSSAMMIYYPGISDDLKEFSLAIKELAKILKLKEKKR